MSPDAQDDVALGARLGAGREAEVYAYGSATVLKLYRPGFGGHRAEALALTALDGHGVAPKLAGVVDRAGRTGLLIERVGGTDLLTVVQRQPWRVLSIARALAATHLAVHRVRAPAGLADLRASLATRIGDAGLPPHLRDFVTGVLGTLPDGDRLCHGDYHPGNVLTAGDRATVIDWGAASRGVPEADHARTLLLLRWAEPLPGTPWPARTVIAAGRALLAGAYAARYRRGADLRQTRSWLIVHAAARLSEGIDSERDMLIGRLERARRTGRI